MLGVNMEGQSAKGFTCKRERKNVGPIVTSSSLMAQLWVSFAKRIQKDMSSQSSSRDCWTTVAGAGSNSIITRRHILQQLSWIVGGATIPSSLTFAAQDTTSGSGAQSVSPV